MTSIYRDIINGTRELMSSVIDNRLNNVMKYLTSITIVMAIPTVISGIYGMNVDEPVDAVCQYAARIFADLCADSVDLHYHDADTA